jgi:GT2 family glycosyltransferase
MSMTPADARFLFKRAIGLMHRGLTSLRMRGWRATWARTKVQFARGTMVPGEVLWRPEPAPFAPFPLPAAWAAPAPRVSVVIPVYGQFARTLDCLRALAAFPPEVPAELIVVDDGSPDETATALPQVAGLRYHRRAENGGFIAACNDGAALARGAFVVFLNNDTIPQAGWLDALLRTFDEHANVGLVGAQLCYPDGRLQEAGGVVFSDGSAWNYGRGESPVDCRYAYVRDCDYASGAAIALPRALFESIGGFAREYAPAYYEDTDLAFAVRARGKRVLYQPDAVVVHDEGGTAGTDTASGAKAYQVRNQGRFAERWRDALATQDPPGTVPTPATVHGRQRQVLIIDALTPRPDHDSGSLRLVNLMRLLQEEGAHVVFFPANRAHDGEATHALQQLGVESWYALYAQRAPAWLREHGARFDTVVLCRHYVASEFLPLVRKHAPQARVVFDTIDLHYLRERRGAELANDRVLQRAAERTRALELDVIAKTDATLVVSDTERALLATDAPAARVEVLSNLHRIAGPGQSFAQRKDLVFVGGFRHPPNIDAVQWFVREVFPRVRERLPDIRFHCIGSHVPDAVRVLGDTPGVIVHGHVPDITPYMDGARIAIAPLRYGAGVKGKINLSMAHGQPVVATACAVEGMHLRDGDDVLVAEMPEAFADAIVRLYGDEALWTRLRDAGLRNVERHFSFEAGRDVVRRVLLGLSRDRGPGTRDH